jgi:hypothetical protein
VNASLRKYAPLLLVALAVLCYLWFSDARTERYRALAYLSEGLAISAPVKMQVAMYYQMEGELPASNAALDLPPPEAFKGQSLVSVGLSDGGIITLTYDAKSGVPNGIIELIPSVDPVRGLIWECFSPSYRRVSTCRYVKGEGAGR